MTKTFSTVRARLGVCAAAAALLSLSGQAFGMNVGETADAQWTSLGSYIPRSISLQNLSAARGGKVCVVGFSQQLTGAPVVGAVPAYALATAGTKQGVWKSMPAAGDKIPALEVGVDIATVSLTPNGGTYLNAGTLTFFFVKSPPSTFNCSSIFLTVANQTAGTVNTHSYPYPRGLFEVSTYPVVVDAKKKTYIDQATVDTSNVDSFEIPLAVNIASVKKIVPTPPSPPNWRVTPIASFGNPVTASGIDRRSLISGADDKGGTSSPFYQWLLKQTNHASVADGFLPLAFGTAKFPYAMIESPNDYLNLKCVLTNPTTNAFTPKGCNIKYENQAFVNNALVNLRDPLNTYFDAELGKFFTAAVNTGSSKYLTVMGDASGRLASEPWIARINRHSCPLYLNPDGGSVAFENQSKTAWVVLCNPRGQVLLFNPNAADPPPSVTVTPQVAIKLIDDGIQEMSVPVYDAFATFKVTSGQCAEAQKQRRLGWNLGQPDTGFVANITKIDCSANTLSGRVVAPPSGAVGTKTQSYAQCPIDAKTRRPVCPQPNPSFTNWLYSNIPVVSGVNWSESASQMVFANDGAFAAWQSVIYASDADLQTVAKSVARNIVEAFNRGIANCNNVTMSPKPTTGYCANINASPKINANAAAASDAYWSNEANFYPAGGFQNYYAQYLHTASLTLSGGATNIFLPPIPPISGSSLSNQSTKMGMAYGFAYDENPGYLNLKPTEIPNAPSKLDPIPSSWWPQPNDGYMILGVVVGNSN